MLAPMPADKSDTPKLIVADEPVSALDLSVQAFLFISHSLAVVETISDQVGVMHGGNFVETGSTAEVFRRPAHACTKGLIDAKPASTTLANTAEHI